MRRCHVVFVVWLNAVAVIGLVVLKMEGFGLRVLIVCDIYSEGVQGEKQSQ